MYPSTFAHLHAEYAPPARGSAVAERRASRAGIGSRLLAAIRALGQRPRLAGAGAQACD